MHRYIVTFYRQSDNAFLTFVVEAKTQSEAEVLAFARVWLHRYADGSRFIEPGDWFRLDNVVRGEDPGTLWRRFLDGARDGLAKLWGWRHA